MPEIETVELEPIGEVQDPSSVVGKVVTIPVIGYSVDGTRVEVKLRFKGKPPVKTTFDMQTAIVPDGKGGAVILPADMYQYLDEIVHPEDRATLHEILHGDVIFEKSTIDAVYTRMSTYYAGDTRPTKRRPGSRDGASRTTPTSPVAASGRGSKGKS
jgi:hypothetical protein